MNRHYVYKVTDKTTGEFYWGSRSCKCDPFEDIYYLGSPRRWKPLNENLIKSNIVEYSTRTIALKVETMLQILDFDNPLNRNYTMHDRWAPTYGKPKNFSAEHRKNLSISKTGKSLSAEHKLSISKGLTGLKKPSLSITQTGKKRGAYGPRKTDKTNN